MFPQVISSLYSLLRISSTGLSEYEIVLELLMEVISALIHLLGSSVIGDVLYASPANAANYVADSFDFILV